MALWVNVKISWVIKNKKMLSLKPSRKYLITRRDVKIMREDLVENSSDQLIWTRKNMMRIHSKVRIFLLSILYNLI